MEPLDCDICNDLGYLDQDEYCSCPRGVFFENKHERTLQMIHGELDTGLDDNYNNIYSVKCFNLYLLSNLPYYEGTRITQEIDYDYYSSDDGYLSDDEYYDFYDNAPWISDYERDLHDEGDCGISCDVCAYEDSIW